MLRTGIVGCGKIADDHAGQILRIRNCKIVGACDVEPLMAKQFAERFAVDRYYDNLARLIEEARPDVVHVTTPPQSHHAIAKQCLECGCHVYLEKPATVNLSEARELIALAESRNLKLTVGHDDQFRHSARRMRQLVREGYLGGPPVHMESYYCYDLTDPGYAKALLADKNHWVRGLPGGLLQNIISHGIARIAEFVQSDAPRVIAYGFTSPLLAKLGEADLVDELRVIVDDGHQSTAYFTFSSRMRPALHQFRIFGPRNGLVVDQDDETLIRLPGTMRKSYLAKFLPSLDFAGQYRANFFTNLRLFARRDFHMKSGMKFLIESFYRSIVEDAPLPIAYREILLTAGIMDEIFKQLRSNRLRMSAP